MNGVCRSARWRVFPYLEELNKLVAESNHETHYLDKFHLRQATSVMMMHKLLAFTENATI